MTHRAQCRGRSLVFEVHGWRGLSAGGGPLGSVLGLGFLSIQWVPYLVSEKMRRVTEALKRLLGDDAHE
jgi:hypothetical protein